MKVDQEKDLLLRHEGAVASLILNRPEKGNSLTAGMLEGIEQVLRELRAQDRVRCLIVRGAGDRAFCTGYDVSLLPVPPTEAEEEHLRKSPPLEGALRALEAFPYPVLAMINGNTFGGGVELALACDIRVGARGIRMGVPAARLGLVYPHRGMGRFLRTLGFGWSLEVLLGGRGHNDETCLRMGLLHYLVDPEKLERYVQDMAREVAQHAPLALKGMKEALYRMAGHPHLAAEEEQLLESLFIDSLKSRDMAEARQAFMEKRRPRFEGR